MSKPAAERFLFHSVREITERQTSCVEEPFYSSRSGRRRKVLSRHPTQVGKNSSVSMPPFHDSRLHAFYWQCHICLQFVVRLQIWNMNTWTCCLFEFILKKC